MYQWGGSGTRRWTKTCMGPTIAVGSVKEPARFPQLSYMLSGKGLAPLG